MNRTLSRRMALLLLPVAALLFWANLRQQERPDAVRLPEKVNLALRRTAHHLLAQAGDTTSTIAPVRQTGDKTWTIRLERPLDYAALPGVLQESLDLHGITQHYDVALLACFSEALLLGYNKLDFTEKNDPPCGSREQHASCYDLQFTLLPEHSAATRAWLRGSGLLAALALIYFFVQGWKKHAPPPRPETKSEPVSILAIGTSLFDPANQTLTVAGTCHTLTYRETKLLNLFCRHPNQLLQRDFILQSVWADEGILVGRSVDMFVSRLRKLLRADPSVQLTNVRGVGYRMEVY